MADANIAPELSCVTIGILTALEEEYAACLDVFDPYRQGAEHQKRATSGTFTCWICQVAPRRGGGQHAVAITLLPDMGNNAAAIAANILLQHCAQTRYLIMCGIAGAVPNPDKCEDHVRLGDIVVSNSAGIIQYDRGKQRDPRQFASTGSGTSPDPLAGFEFRGPPRPPSPELLDAVRRMHAEEHRLGRNDYRDWEAKIKDFLDRCQDKQKWKRPHYNKDRLVDSPDGKGPTAKPPIDGARRKIDGIRYPRVFRGPIGTANVVQGDPIRRNALRDTHGIKAIEMESSGVADVGWVAGVGYLIVRGTCDYCNTAKADAWHDYAALIAACYAKTVVEYMHPESRSSGVEMPAYPPRPNIETVENDAACALRDLEPSTASRSKGSPTIDSTRGEATTAPPTQVSASIIVDLGLEQAMSSRDEKELAVPEPTHATTKDALADLISTIDDLLNEFQWEKADSLAVDLEKRLKMLPKKGSVVRQGWMVLARLEGQRLREAKQLGHKIDVGRLRALREEAENVID